MASSNGFELWILFLLWVTFGDKIWSQSSSWFNILKFPARIVEFLRLLLFLDLKVPREPTTSLFSFSKSSSSVRTLAVKSFLFFFFRETLPGVAIADHN